MALFAGAECKHTTAAPLQLHKSVVSFWMLHTQLNLFQELHVLVVKINMLSTTTPCCMQAAEIALALAGFD